MITIMTMKTIANGYYGETYTNDDGDCDNNDKTNRNYSNKSNDNNDNKKGITVFQAPACYQVEWLTHKFMWNAMCAHS